MAIQEIRIPQTATSQSDCVTIIARSPGQAIAEFHRRGLGKQGYAICGRVVPHRFEVVTDSGDVESLFDGEQFYSATFTRSAGSRSN
jgi:hypothetical protein